MDLLESGREQRAPGELRVRTAPLVVPALTLAALAVLAAGVVAVDRDRDRQERQRAEAVVEAEAARPDLAARPLGGFRRSDGRQGSGVFELEVRNGRRALALLSVEAQVPGVVAPPVSFAGGRSLGTDDRLELRLPFTVPDCAGLQPQGRLVLRVRVGGAEQELVLGLTADPASSQPGLVGAAVLLRACG